MSEAEKKWDKADAEIIETWCYSDLQTKDLPRLSRKAYKAALRREIEERKKHLEIMIDIHKGERKLEYRFRLQELIENESKLDTVEP